MSSADAKDDSTITFASAAPSQIPGQMRPPRSSAAASAIPEGGHTAVA